MKHLLVLIFLTVCSSSYCMDKPNCTQIDYNPHLESIYQNIAFYAATKDATALTKSDALHLFRIDSAYSKENIKQRISNLYDLAHLKKDQTPFTLLKTYQQLNNRVLEESQFNQICNVLLRAQYLLLTE